MYVKSQYFVRYDIRYRIIRRSITVALVLVALLMAWNVVPAFSQDETGVTRTPWQMNRGEGAIPVKVESATGTKTRLANTNDPDAFAMLRLPAVDGDNVARIPAADDTGWGEPPLDKDGNISLVESSVIPCNTQVDFTYFQTQVTVPANAAIKTFEVAFAQVDDNARVYVFNSQHPNGKFLQDGIVGTNVATADLSSLVVVGETNRVVIVQVDTCAVKNTIKNVQIEVQVEGGDAVEEVPVVTPVVDTPGCDSCGDVHIFTPDGLVYDFQEVGEFLAMQSSDAGVVVQARQETWVNNPRVSVNTAVAFNVDGIEVEFYVKEDVSFYLDNKPQEGLPSETVTLANGGRIDPISVSGTRSEYYIYWPDDIFAARVIMHGSSHIDYGIAKYDSQTYAGFLGNLDGNAKNDLTTSDGEVIAPPPSIADLKRFGDSWRVPAGDSLFVGAEDAVDQPDTSVQPLTLPEIDPADRAKAEQICEEAGITDLTALRNCVYDVAVTDDPVFVESAKAVEEAVKDLPPSAKVPAQPGETLAGNIFNANQAARSGISILDGDDLIITTGKLADGTGYIRFNIYRDGMYVASYSVSTDVAVADALTGAAFATMELPAEEAEAGIPEEDLVLLQDAIPVCAEGMTLLAENMYEYPDAADAYAEAYQVFAQEYLPGCEVVSGFVSTNEEEVGIFFDEVGFSFEDFVASDGYSKPTWSDTVGTITNIGTRVPQYCPNAHLSQYDCVKATERSLLSIEAALPALELLYGFSEQ